MSKMVGKMSACDDSWDDASMALATPATLAGAQMASGVRICGASSVEAWPRRPVSNISSPWSPVMTTMVWARSTCCSKALSQASSSPRVLR